MTYSCLHLLIKLITTYVQSKQAITCSTDHINNTVNYIGVYIPLTVCFAGVYQRTNGGQVLHKFLQVSTTIINLRYAKVYCGFFKLYATTVYKMSLFNIYIVYSLYSTSKLTLSLNLIDQVSNIFISQKLQLFKQPKYYALFDGFCRNVLLNES